MILSFALTTREFLSGKKTESRRFWKPEHLRRWQRAWDQGRLTHEAWDKIPVAGGKRIGVFRLTARPYVEKLREMPEGDLTAEGGMCDSVQAFIALVVQDPDTEAAVIRFEKL
jgi:hypothetical protein